MMENKKEKKGERIVELRGIQEMCEISTYSQRVR